jgi:hypothetical protein
MDWRIGNLKLHHKWSLCSLHSFVLKHILHITILRTIYDLVSHLTTYMTGILHKYLYFDMLIITSETIRTRFSFLLILQVSTLWVFLWHFV